MTIAVGMRALAEGSSALLGRSCGHGCEARGKPVLAVAARAVFDGRLRPVRLMIAGTRFRVDVLDDVTNGLVTNGLPAWPRGRRLALAKNPPHDQHDLRPVARM